MLVRLSTASLFQALAAALEKNVTVAHIAAETGTKLVSSAPRPGACSCGSSHLVHVACSVQALHSVKYYRATVVFHCCLVVLQPWRACWWPSACLQTDHFPWNRNDGAHHAYPGLGGTDPRTRVGPPPFGNPCPPPQR